MSKIYTDGYWIPNIMDQNQGEVLLSAGCRHGEDGEITACDSTNRNALRAICLAILSRQKSVWWKGKDDVWVTSWRQGFYRGLAQRPLLHKLEQWSQPFRFCTCARSHASNVSVIKPKCSCAHRKFYT